MEKLQELINACWVLIDQNKVDGDQIPSLDDCQEEVYELQRVLKQHAVGSYNCDHELRAVSDKRYPFKPIRCVKCGYEP